MAQKILITILMVFAFHNSLLFSQITAGRYIITLAENDQAVVLDLGNRGIPLYLSDRCPDINDNCIGKIFDIKNMPEMPGKYSINHVGTGRYLGWELDSRLANYYLRFDTSFLGIGRSRSQSFIINDVGGEIYTIQPNFYNPDGINTWHLGIPRSLARYSELGFFVKDERYPGSNFNDKRNINWRLIKIPDATTGAPLPPSKLFVDITTGADDLAVRDFQENPSIIISFHSGRKNLELKNINKNGGWAGGSIRRLEFHIPRNLPFIDLKSIEIRRNQKGSANNINGITADNWNINKLTVSAKIWENDKYVYKPILSKSGFPLYRFIYEGWRASNPKEGNLLVVPFNTGIVGSDADFINTMYAPSSILFEFSTGGDDLRGNGDNLDVEIELYSSSRKMTLHNVNASRSWGGFFTKQRVMPLPEPLLNLNDIKSITLRHTGGGGLFADNWNMDGCKIYIGTMLEYKLLVSEVGYPLHRFTGESRTKKFILK